MPEDDPQAYLTYTRYDLQEEVLARHIVPSLPSPRVDPSGQEPHEVAGVIGDVGVTDTTLSDAEIEALYWQGAEHWDRGRLL